MPSSDPNRDDKSQPPMSNGFHSHTPSGSSNNIYTSRSSIWNPSSFNSTHARGPSLSRDPTENGAVKGMPATNGIMSNDSKGWNNYPWNTAESSRSTSTSPNRTRDTSSTLNRPAAFNNGADTQPPVGVRNGFNGAQNGFRDTLNQRSTNGSSAFVDSSAMSNLPSRDPNAPASRQSQNSPGFPEALYNGRGHQHNHSSSFSQRNMANQPVPSLHQAANSRAFNLNQQLDDDLSGPFGRRATVDHTATNGLGADMPTQPFQFNPGTRPFGDTGNSRFGSEDQDGQMATLTNQLAGMQRPSSERVSPPSAYRFDNGNNNNNNNSPRGFAQNPADPWSSRSSSRDPRTNHEFERRGSGQPSYTSQYNASYFAPQQFNYPQMPPQFQAPNYVEQYNQILRHPMVPNYAMQMPGSFGVNGMVPQPRHNGEADPIRGMRSQALEEFKLNKNKKSELREYYGHMVEFSGDQHGSRFIQAKLETANSDEKDTVFREIEPNAVQLMKDVFGNYVVQKFFEHGNQVQKKILADKIKPQTAVLSVQVYACRVVQKALEHVLVDQQLELVKELEPEALRIATDQNGNHVMQKVICLLDRQNLGFMMDAIRGQVMTLSCHQYGCRVIQRMMDHGTEEDNEAIVQELRPSAHLLLPDQFGNYVAQHIIVHGKYEDRLMMVQLVLNQLVDLCKHKFASNVVETCIIHGVPELRTLIRKRFEAVGSDGRTVLDHLMKDGYGNYVVQKMTTFLEGEEQAHFVEQLKPHFYELKKQGNSRQLQAMDKMLDAHSRGELLPDQKAYGHVKAVAPAPLSNGELAHHAESQLNGAATNGTSQPLRGVSP